MIEHLPRTITGEVIGKQLLRCATSVGANYRAATRAKSNRDFLNKMKICEEEIDETQYWLDLTVQGSILPAAKMQATIQEASELCAIITSICKTTATKLR